MAVALASLEPSSDSRVALDCVCVCVCVYMYIVYVCLKVYFPINILKTETSTYIYIPSTTYMYMYILVMKPGQYYTCTYVPVWFPKLEAYEMLQIIGLLWATVPQWWALIRHNTCLLLT